MLFKFSHTIFSLKLKDPTWSASLRGVLGSVNSYYMQSGKKINRLEQLFTFYCRLFSWHYILPFILTNTRPQ